MLRALALSVLCSLLAASDARSQQPTEIDMHKLTLFALRAAQANQRQIALYAVDNLPPATLDRAAEELAKAIGTDTTRVLGTLVGDTLHIRIERQRGSDEEQIAFAANSLSRLAGTLT